MNILEYVTAHRAKTTKIKSDIVERWESRVVANGLHLRGAAGAQSYAGQYLKGAGAPKVIGFALIAEAKGFPEMANEFWAIAYHLETGKREQLGDAPAAGAAVVPAVVTKESFGQAPHLPVAIDRSRVALLVNDPNIGFQRKVDGEHLLTRCEKRTVTGGNKRGLVTIVPLPIADALAEHFNDTVADGEKVGVVYHLFDLLSHKGRDLRNLGVAQRHAELVTVMATVDSPALQLVPLIVGTEAKAKFIAELEAAGEEGFVAKRLDATYGEADAMWKFQFRAMSAFIAGEQRGEKRSVGIFVRRADGTLRDMGFVTVKANQDVPAPGSIIEVKYLYAFPAPDGKLHQPEFKHTRTDATSEDCLESKLRVKAA